MICRQTGTCRFDLRPWVASVTITAAWLLSSTSQAAALYYESFESRRMDTGDFTTGGACFPYSTKFSGSIARVPGASIRLELHGDDKNDTGCKSTLTKVPLNWKYVDGMKSRTEIAHAALVPRVSAAPLGSKLWYQWSVYYPSNEGTFDSWWKGTGRIIVGQISGWGSGDSTVEVEFMLGNSGRLDLDQHYTTADTSVEQKIKKSGIATLTPDTWNDIRVYFNRSYTNSGQVTIWVNDKKVYDRVGPSAIKENQLARFKTGMYFAYEVRPEVMVSYIDEVRVGEAEEDVKIGSGTTAAAAPEAPALRVE